MSTILNFGVSYAKILIDEGEKLSIRYNIRRLVSGEKLMIVTVGQRMDGEPRGGHTTTQTGKCRNVTHHVAD
jgi:hypothetical protein